MSVSKTFCILPWVHFKHGLNKQFSPCCSWSGGTISSSIYASDNLKLLNSNFMIDIRRKMLLGESVDGCNRCQIKEKASGKSPRIFWNEKIPIILDSSSFHQIRYMEITFDNTCNLACKMCNSSFSSSWSQTYKHLEMRGLIVPTEKITSKFDYEKIDFSGVEYLKILGGEPMYSKEFLSFLEYLKSKDLLKIINFEIITNGDAFNEQIANLLSNAKSMSVAISVDGIGLVNEYVRTNSRWDKLLFNLERYSKITDPKKISLHTTISLLNIRDLCNIEKFKPTFKHTYAFDIFSKISLKYSPPAVRNFLLSEIRKTSISPEILKSVEIFFQTFSCDSEDDWIKTLQFIKYSENSEQSTLKDVDLKLFTFLKENYNYDSI